MLSGRPPPVGSTRDIMDMRQIIENQALQLQSQQEQIQQLKDTIQSQQQNYLFLLDSNRKLWSTINSLEKEVRSLNDDNYQQQLERDTLKKPKEKENIEVEKLPKKKNCAEKERQLVVPASKKEQTISVIQRLLNANPDYAKQIEKLAKIVQKKNQQKSEPEEEVSEIERDRKKKKRHHKNHEIIEKITLSRTVYGQNDNYLSTTIDDTLDKYNIELSSVGHKQRHNRRRHSPSASPTITEVTSSSLESEYDSEDNSNSEEESYHSPVRNQRQRRSDDYSDDDETATNVPDQFDDDDMSYESEIEPPPQRHRRQRDEGRVTRRKY